MRGGYLQRGGLMAFRWPVPGRLVGREVEWSFFVCSAVIPMGWINTVSLFQHLHRRLGVSAPPAGSGFPEEWERRDRSISQSHKLQTHWVQYYLHDFDAPEIVPEEEVRDIQGSISEVQKEERAAYARQGVDISLKKSQHRDPHMIRG